jgi:ABC-type lipoprotein export system ATPase subunit
MRIELERVALSYGPRILFTDLDAVVEPVGVTVIVGPSGSGKSSLLAALAGYRKPSAGGITFTADDGSDRTDPDPTLITWVPQGSNSLPARSAVDNVMIGALARGARQEEAAERASSALARVGLSPLSKSRARELSGGELQRLGFARALAAATPFIFADEPTSSLDAANVDIIAELLRELAGSSTVVVATHDPTLVAAATKVIDLRAAA